MLRQIFLEIAWQNWPFKIGLSLLDFKQLLVDSGTIVHWWLTLVRVTHVIVWCPYLILMVLEKFFFKLPAVTHSIWWGAQLSMVRAPAITNLLRTFWFYFQKQHSLRMVSFERPVFLPRFVFSTLPCANPWCFPSLLPILQLSLPMRNSQPVIKPNVGFKKKIILVKCSH